MFCIFGCNKSNPYVAFEKSQKERFKKNGLDVDHFNLSGRVQYLIFPHDVQENEKEVDKAMESLGIAKKKEPICDLIREILDKHKLSEFDYFEFDRRGNVIRVISGPCTGANMKEYEYENNQMIESRDYRPDGKVIQAVTYAYNSFELLYKIRNFYRIDNSLQEVIDKTDISYTNNFMTIVNTLDNEKNEVIMDTIIIDKQNNRIEKLPQLVYTWNEDSLPTNKFNRITNNSTSFIYDTNGNKVRQTNYDYDMNSTITKTFYYNIDNELIESMKQDSNSLSVEKFNQYGQIKDYYRVNFGNNNYGYHSEWETYNANGDKSSSSVIRIHEEGDQIEEKKKYRYKYDENNNWIEMTVLQNDTIVNISRRIIVYY